MTRETDVAGHVLYALRNAQVKTWPFPHFFCENIFPEAFYWSLLYHLGKKDDYQAVEGRYPARTFGNVAPYMGLSFMETPEFLSEVTKIFSFAIKTRYSDKKLVVYKDIRLVRDGHGYQIGPHTDAVWKLVSLLFYLPPDSRHKQHGTSIYLPKDREFRCAGGPHHTFEKFDRISTAPYTPNSCFGFFKTDNSFHGVEPVTSDFHRDVLLFNVYDKDLYLQHHNHDAKEPSS